MIQMFENFVDNSYYITLYIKKTLSDKKIMRINNITLVRKLWIVCTMHYTFWF